MISRKKIAKKGKNKWQRGIDVSAVQDQIGSEAKAQNLKNKVKELQQAKKQKGQALFKVETEPDQDLKKKLDKDRFQKKKTSFPEKLELQIKAMAHNTKRHQKSQPEKKEEKSVEKKGNPLDLWGSSATDNSKISKNAARHQAQSKVGTIQVPNILKPHGGESYNPSGDDHMALLKTIVDIDDKLVNGIQMPPRVKDLSKREVQSKAAKPRTKKEAKVFAELEVKRKIKQNVLMEYNYGKFLKDAKKDSAAHGKILILIFR